MSAVVKYDSEGVTLEAGGVAKKTMADLSPFFDMPSPRAVIVTDAKLDDAICLWYFFVLNFCRPAHHSVEIVLLLSGIRDVAGGACLCRHLFQCAKEYALSTQAPCLENVSCRVLVSRRPAKAAPRHEVGTYAPYNNGAPGFPAVAEETTFWQDEPAAALAADFVGVMCQFFNFEVVDSSSPSGLQAGLLDYIVPRPGGVLAFQMGFNTNISGYGALRQALWTALIDKVRAAEAKMAFISNGFSFHKDEWPGALKPGTAAPGTPFIAALRSQSPALWGHLVQAGLEETLLFATDQMSKWLTFLHMDGVDFDKSGLRSSIQELRERRNLQLQWQDRTSVSAGLHAMFLGKASAFENGRSTVLDTCQELHSIVEAACGPRIADYLGRAVKALKSFGQSLEITDGQHFMALFQIDEPVLDPVDMRLNSEDVIVAVFDVVGSDSLMWAARGVSVPRSFEWLERGLQVPNARTLTSLA